jgi:acetyl-CoA carboxylase biotin carboxyl carrier protein
MIDLEFVESLIRALDESSLDSLELERGGTRIRLSKSPPVYLPSTDGAPSSVSESSPTGGNSGVPGGGRPSGVQTPSAEDRPESHESPSGHLVEVVSPMVGTFYRAPAPDAPPYVDVGARVGTGSVLCIIEAMKLMNELESEVGGTVAKIMVENGQPVEYGQVLFLIDPS